MDKRGTVRRQIDPLVSPPEPPAEPAPKTASSTGTRRDDAEFLVRELNQLVDSLLDSLGGPETQQRRSQFEHTNRAVEGMKAVDVPVPDTLIALQEELAQSLESSLQAEATLEFIGQRLDTIVGQLDQVRKTPKSRIVRGLGAESSGKRTPLRVLEDLILEYLTSMGGSARRICIRLSPRDAEITGS